MRILLTAGPTREPIDPVRYIGNRSSGRMGAAIAHAARAAGHNLTAIVGPIEVELPPCRAIRVETARQMHDRVLAEWPDHDLLIMAAAVADYRPRYVSPVKLSRSAGPVTLELEPTEDIAAAACAARRPDQRVIGFSLERAGDQARALQKLRSKRLDLIVYNPIETLGADEVAAGLIWPDGSSEAVPLGDKRSFAVRLLEHAARLFVPGPG